MTEDVVGEVRDRLTRWRLVLGEAAAETLAEGQTDGLPGLSADDKRRDEALQALYDADRRGGLGGRVGGHGGGAGGDGLLARRALGLGGLGHDAPWTSRSIEPSGMASQAGRLRASYTTS